MINYNKDEQYPVNKDEPVFPTCWVEVEVSENRFEGFTSNSYVSSVFGFFVKSHIISPSFVRAHVSFLIED